MHLLHTVTASMQVVSKLPVISVPACLVLLPVRSSSFTDWRPGQRNYINLLWPGLQATEAGERKREAGLDVPLIFCD